MNTSLTELTAANIIHVYNHLNASLEFSRALTVEPIVPKEVKALFNSVAASNLNNMDRIRNMMPRSDRAIFDEQVVNNDPLKLANILFLYAKMSPEIQLNFEKVGELLAKGEVIEFI